MQARFVRAPLFLNPRVSQVLLGSLLALALVALGAVFYQWYATGVADLLMLLRIGLVLLGLLVLYNVAAARRAALPDGLRCGRCGSRTFETLRSLDRRRVATCFARGTKSVVATGDAIQPRAPPGASGG